MKKFLEKYFEFKGKFRTRQNIIEHFIAENMDLFYEEKDVEEILDKHFVRKEKLLMLKHDFDDLKRKTSLSDKPVNIDKQGRVMMFNDYFKKTYIEKQKVKEAIDKIKRQNYGWTNSRRFKEFEQELGLK